MIANLPREESNGVTAVQDDYEPEESNGESAVQQTRYNQLQLFIKQQRHRQTSLNIMKQKQKLNKHGHYGPDMVTVTSKVVEIQTNITSTYNILLPYPLNPVGKDQGSSVAILSTVITNRLKQESINFQLNHGNNYSMHLILCANLKFLTRK